MPQPSRGLAVLDFVVSPVFWQRHWPPQSAMARRSPEQAAREESVGDWVDMWVGLRVGYCKGGQVGGKILVAYLGK